MRDTVPVSQAWALVGDELPLSSSLDLGSPPQQVLLPDIWGRDQEEIQPSALSEVDTGRPCKNSISQPAWNAFPFLSILKLVERGGASAMNPTQEAKVL